MRYACFLLLSLALSGCSTIAPSPVTANTPAVVGNDPDAGIVRWTYDAQGKRTGALVRQWYVDNYTYMVYKFGKNLQPPVTQPTGVTPESGGFYRIDLQGAGIYAQLTEFETPQVSVKKPSSKPAKK